MTGEQEDYFEHVVVSIGGEGEIEVTVGSCAGKTEKMLIHGGFFGEGGNGMTHAR